VVSDDEPDLPLFAGEPLPAWRCPRCGTEHEEKLEDSEECRARVEFRRYARGTFAKLDW
jgi:hypothetical protein